ncbi:MAG TPA: hypothetical protein VM847_20400 [Tahibacter sp.]|nr:hypothetical protein [Tahibacter sp.]
MTIRSLPWRNRLYRERRRLGDGAAAAPTWACHARRPQACHPAIAAGSEGRSDWTAKCHGSAAPAICGALSAVDFAAPAAMPGHLMDCSDRFCDLSAADAFLVI